MARVTRKAPIRPVFSSGRRDYGHNATAGRFLQCSIRDVVVRLGARLMGLTREGFAFLVVGTLGFVAHAALLTALVRGAGIAPYPAWFPAFAAAVTLTYLLNRGWTFRHRAGADRGREFTRYGLLQCLGAAINNAVYGFLLWLHPLFAAEPVLALAGGSVAAMLFNYVSARQLAFRGAPATVLPRDGGGPEPGRSSLGS
jgi:putative flippase GtrA